MTTTVTMQTTGSIWRDMPPAVVNWQRVKTNKRDAATVDKLRRLGSMQTQASNCIRGLHYADE